MVRVLLMILALFDVSSSVFAQVGGSDPHLISYIDGCSVTAPGDGHTYVGCSGWGIYDPSSIGYRGAPTAIFVLDGLYGNGHAPAEAHTRTDVCNAYMSPPTAFGACQAVRTYLNDSEWFGHLPQETDPPRLISSYNVGLHTHGYGIQIDGMTGCHYVSIVLTVMGWNFDQITELSNPVWFCR